MVYYCVTHAHSCIHTYTPIHTPTHTHTHSPKHTHVQMLHSSSIDTKTTLRTPTPTLHTHSIHSQAPHTPTKHPTYVYCVYNYIIYIVCKMYYRYHSNRLSIGTIFQRWAWQQIWVLSPAPYALTAMPTCASRRCACAMRIRAHSTAPPVFMVRHRHSGAPAHLFIYLTSNYCGKILKIDWHKVK